MCGGARSLLWRGLGSQSRHLSDIFFPAKGRILFRQASYSLWPSPSTLLTNSKTMPCVADISCVAKSRCFPRRTCHMCSLKHRTIYKFWCQSLVFLRNVLPKYYPFFEENNNFINCQMFCWIIQFIKFVVQGVKNISYFPEPVIMWVIMVRRVITVFRVKYCSSLFQ